jgi:hypothetical protein
MHHPYRSEEPCLLKIHYVVSLLVFLESDTQHLHVLRKLIYGVYVFDHSLACIRRNQYLVIDYPGTFIHYQLDFSVLTRILFFESLLRLSLNTTFASSLFFLFISIRYTRFLC